VKVNLNGFGPRQLPIIITQKKLFDQLGFNRVKEITGEEITHELRLQHISIE